MLRMVHEMLESHSVMSFRNLTGWTDQAIRWQWEGAQSRLSDTRLKLYLPLSVSRSMALVGDTDIV